MLPVTVKLLGLAQGDPSVPTTGPGATSKFLFDALARRYDLVDRSGVDLSPLQRYLLAAVTFHPSRDKWTTRLYWRGRLAFNLRTLNSRRKLRKLDEPVDLVMQVYGLFRTDALGDALLRILQDPQHARLLGTNGRAERMSPHLERALVQGPPGAVRPSRFRRDSSEAAERPRA
jgi:hypothetical protein